MKTEVENKNNNSKMSLIVASIAGVLAIASLIVAILALISRDSGEVARKSKYEIYNGLVMLPNGTYNCEVMSENASVSIRQNGSEYTGASLDKGDKFTITFREDIDLRVRNIDDGQMIVCTAQ